MTKFQGLFLHCALLLLLLEKLPVPTYLPLPRNRSWSLLVIIIFLGVSAISLLSYIPNYFATFATYKRPNIFFLLTFFALLLPFTGRTLGKIVNATVELKRPWLFRRIQPHEEVMQLMGVPYWAAVGLLLTFLFHFALLMTPGNAAEYLFFDWRMLFLKVSKHNSVQGTALSTLWWSVKFHFLPLALWIAATVYVWRRIDRRKKTFIALFAALMAVSLALVTRGRVQDSLWNDVLILWGFSLVIPALPALPRWVFPAIALAVGSWSLCHLSINALDGVDYEIKPLANFWQEPYESPMNPYSEIMAELRQDNFKTSQANELAEMHPILKQTLHRLWHDHQPDLRHISLASPEFKNYLLITPRRTESVITPRRLKIWLGSNDLENYTDCPLTDSVVVRGEVRWREIWPGTKKCRILSKKVRVALNFRELSPER